MNTKAYPHKSFTTAKNVKFRKAQQYGLKNSSVYEMQLGAKWFFINRKNIVFKGTLDQQRELINHTLDGETCELLGHYDRTAHKLFLVL